MKNTNNLENELRSIHSLLQELKMLFILANQDKLEATKKGLLPKDSVKERIYNLCDGTKTAKEISDAIDKEPKYVNSYLSILRREGLIRTVEREKRLVHEQVF